MSEQNPKKIYLNIINSEGKSSKWLVVGYEEVPQDSTTNIESITVFEHHAYDTLANRLVECEKALEYYADTNNWICGFFSYDSLVGDTSDPDEFYKPTGGKRAREYFKKWEKKDDEGKRVQSKRPNRS